CASSATVAEMLLLSVNDRPIKNPIRTRPPRPRSLSEPRHAWHLIFRRGFRHDGPDAFVRPGEAAQVPYQNEVRAEYHVPVGHAHVTAALRGCYEGQLRCWRCGQTVAAARRRASTTLLATSRSVRKVRQDWCERLAS